MQNYPVGISYIVMTINLFLSFMTIVVCSLICLCTFVAFNTNNIEADQVAQLGEAWSGFIVFASMVKAFCSAFEFMQQTWKTHKITHSYLGAWWELYCRPYWSLIKIWSEITDDHMILRYNGRHCAPQKSNMK